MLRLFGVVWCICGCFVYGRTVLWVRQVTFGSVLAVLFVWWFMGWLLLHLRLRYLIVLILWFFIEVFPCLVFDYLISLCLVVAPWFSCCLYGGLWLLIVCCFASCFGVVLMVLVFGFVYGWARLP